MDEQYEENLTDGSETDIWYLALKKIQIVQAPGAKPSSIRFYPGQRFTLDGDEQGVDLEGLLRLKAIKLYEESDVEWAQAKLAEMPSLKRRNRG